MTLQWVNWCSVSSVIALEMCVQPNLVLVEHSPKKLSVKMFDAAANTNSSNTRNKKKENMSEDLSPSNILNI